MNMDSVKSERVERTSVSNKDILVQRLFTGTCNVKEAPQASRNVPTVNSMSPMRRSNDRAPEKRKYSIAIPKMMKTIKPLTTKSLFTFCSPNELPIIFRFRFN